MLTSITHWLILGFFALLFILFVSAVVFILLVIKNDKKQTQHSVKRNYPFWGWLRYILEHKRNEIKQYFVDDEEKGTPYAPGHFEEIVKKGKYLKSVIAFGGKRDYQEPGYYIKNAFFSKQTDQLKVDNSFTIETKKYVTDKESFAFGRFEHQEDAETKPWLLEDQNAIVIGKNTCKYPFVTKSPIGMSGMSFPALGDHAITSLSVGLGLARSFMNTGEGGLTKYHLKGDVDIICQIGPAKFGFRNPDGTFSFEKLREKAAIPKVKAFELKLGQGAKIRGGHVEGAKVTPEVAEIRGVEPWKSIDSPNRFDEFYDTPSLLYFLEKVRDVAEKPVGIKIVVGGPDTFDEFVQEMKALNIYPDFISVDGGEGGSGATYKFMADSMGLPIKPALMIVDETLKKHGVRDKVKIIASGKLFSADRIAIALSMGADLVQLARGMMIAVGCIGARKCHSNDCPVGVATTNPKLQRALVIEEKQYRAANYVISLREDLFSLAAACGLTSPTHFSEKHVLFKGGDDIVRELSDIKRKMISVEEMRMEKVMH
ncbi:glutamate synthase-related protein [Pseudoneobacillus sp. C159]